MTPPMEGFMPRSLSVLLSAAGLVVVSIYLGLWVVGQPETGLTVLVGLVPALVCAWFIIKGNADRRFLLRLFIAALALRWAVAFLIYTKHLQLFFGGDAQTFDIVGNALSQAWQGHGSLDTPYMHNYLGLSRSGWGMFYYVGSVYYLIGQNQLAVQLINCALGAAACVAVYRIALLIYPERRPARIAAALTAFAPSMILWSSQMLKDAPIVLSLCLCALYTLKVRKRFQMTSLLLLLASLFCLFALRHYAFYIMFVAVAGALVLTPKRLSPLRIAQGVVMVVVIGGALAYFGAGNVPQETFDLKHIQAAREWSARAANSGFGGDVDITDPKAALGYLPLGLLYVLFAPFPWMITNVRQLITLPELIAWWAMIPMLARGFWYGLRHRLKETFAISIFTIGLTLVYALYQSNVGTAYRHRAQLYIFFFIFISIGLELRRAAKERRRMMVAEPAFYTFNADAAARQVPRPSAAAQLP
jgi:4-amino-4-deoxy-L-arabinose transferase-like glycosyltransferase